LWRRVLGPSLKLKAAPVVHPRLVSEPELTILDLDLCRNTMKYMNTHKRRDAAEIRLHFINKKSLKYAYRQNGNKLAMALVAYL
jgi:hypothetical protein